MSIIRFEIAENNKFSLEGLMVRKQNWQYHLSHTIEVK